MGAEWAAVQGAKIAENAFVDTLDVVDFDSLEVGENTVIGEGTTIVGHTFDSNGDIVFKKVTPRPTAPALLANCHVLCCLHQLPVA